MRFLLKKIKNLGIRILNFIFYMYNLMVNRFYFSLISFLVFVLFFNFIDQMLLNKIMRKTSIYKEILINISNKKVYINDKIINLSNHNIGIPIRPHQIQIVYRKKNKNFLHNLFIVKFFKKYFFN